MASEMRIALLYFIGATLWIILSDALIDSLFGFSAPLVSAAQTYKGSIFVILTSIMLLILLRFEFRRRRRLEENSNTRAAHFQHLFHTNPLPMWIYDTETLRFLEVNAAACRHYGYSRDEFLALSLVDIRPPEDVERLLANLAAPRPEYQDSGLWRHRLRDGTVIQVDIRSNRIEYGGRSAVLVVANDVTERENARADLQRSKDRLSSIIRAAPLAIFLMDVDWRVLLWNPAAERIFGWSEDEVIGKPVPTIPPQFQAEANQLRDDLVAGGQTFVGRRLKRVRKDGTLINVSLSTGVLRSGDTVTEIISVMEDITERKRLEAEMLEKERLRLALDKEIELRRMRDHFISRVSHEFRNPLTAITTSSGIIQRYYDRLSPTEREGHFDRMQQQIDRLVSLVDDLLMVMRAEAVADTFLPKPLDLIAFCRAVMDDFDPGPDGVSRLRLIIEVDSVLVNADEKIFRQALDNLVSNALKYSSGADPVEVAVRLMPDGSHVSIHVIDHGIGIPAADQPHIFDPFFRASNAHAHPGTGLGLVIAQQAVTLHGGTLTLQSVEGKGTIFQVVMPIYDQ